MSNTTSPNTKKQKKSYADCPPIQLILRDNKGWRLYKQHHKSGKLQIQSSTKPCTDADIVFSSDGAYFAVLLEEGIEIYESYGGRLITFLKHYRVRNVYFSPLNRFIVSYHHRRQDDKHGNCWVWKWHNDTKDDTNDKRDDTQDKKQNDDTAKEDDSIQVVYQFYLPEFDKKRVPLQFTNDEIIAARITNNGVLIHDVRRLHYKSNNIIGKLDVAKAASVVVAPCKRPRDGYDSSKSQNSYLLAVFAMPKNNKAATVTVYEYQYSLAMNKRSSTTKLFSKLSQRAFYGVDQCELLWDPTNSYHHNLLAIASSDVDTSGKSYYGNQTVYLLSSRTSVTTKIPISEKGKLQDVKWHSYGKEFVMIDDHPQKISVFDYRGNNVANLGQYARNLIRFSRDGRFLWCGGFGNLTGEMTFYDYKNIKENVNKSCLGYGTDDACRYFQWSPDSSTFLTARLYPYMTVDNGFRIYKYNGQMLYQETFDRLYQIAYRPSLKHVYPQRSPSPNAQRKGKSLPKPQAKKRYVPPHLRSKSKKGKSGEKESKKPNVQKPPQNVQKPPPQQAQPPQVPPAHTQRTQQGFTPHHHQGAARSHAPQAQQPQQGYAPRVPPAHAQQAQHYYHQQAHPQQNYYTAQGGGYYTQTGQQPAAHPQHATQGAYGQQRRYYEQVAPQQNTGGAAVGNQHMAAMHNQFNGMNITANHNNNNNANHNNNNNPTVGGVHHINGANQVVESGAQGGAIGVAPDQSGADGNKKKKKRKRSRKNKNSANNPGAAGGGNNVNSSAQGGGYKAGSGFKPGLHDNKRWARGSKYTE